MTNNTGRRNCGCNRKGFNSVGSGPKPGQFSSTQQTLARMRAMRAPGANASSNMLNQSLSRGQFLKSVGVGAGALAVAGLGLGGIVHANGDPPADVVIEASGEIDMCTGYKRLDPWYLVYGGPEPSLPGTKDVCELQAAFMGVDTVSDLNHDGYPDCAFTFMTYVDLDEDGYPETIMEKTFYYAEDPTQRASYGNPSLVPSVWDAMHVPQIPNPNSGKNYAGTNIIELAATSVPFYMGDVSDDKPNPPCMVPSVQVVISRNLTVRGQKTGTYYTASDHPDLAGLEKQTLMIGGFHNLSAFNFDQSVDYTDPEHPFPTNPITVVVKDVDSFNSYENFAGCGGFGDYTYENLRIINKLNWSPALYGSNDGKWTVRNCLIRSQGAAVWHTGFIGLGMGIGPGYFGGEAEITGNDLVSYWDVALYSWLNIPGIHPTPKVYVHDNPRIEGANGMGFWETGIPVIVDSNPQIVTNGLFGIDSDSYGVNISGNTFYSNSPFASGIYLWGSGGTIQNNNFTHCTLMRGWSVNSNYKLVHPGCVLLGPDTSGNYVDETQTFLPSGNVCTQIADLSVYNANPRKIGKNFVVGLNSAPLINCNLQTYHQLMIRIRQTQEYQQLKSQLEAKHAPHAQWLEQMKFGPAPFGPPNPKWPEILKCIKKGGTWDYNTNTCY